MKCADCGSDVPDHGAFCSECGAQLTGRSSASGDPKAEIQALLARANLLRVRGQWEAAAEQCAQVMRLDPQNAAAHSLLGEIYDNQGHLERAIRWYEEALELNPHSAADRAKLARVRELLQARTAHAAGASTPRFSWLRVAGLAGAVLCGGIILLAALFAGGPPPAADTPPAASAEYRASAPRSSPPPRWLTNEERQLGSRVAPAVTPPLRLVELQIDPRDQSVDLTLLVDLLAYRAGHSAGTVRDRLLYDGYRIAYQTLGEHPPASRVVLRVVVLANGRRDSPEYAYLFAGTLPAAALLAHPSVVTTADLTRVYQSPWWNPRLLP